MLPEVTTTKGRSERQGQSCSPSLKSAGAPKHLRKTVRSTKGTAPWASSPSLRPACPGAAASRFHHRVTLTVPSPTRWRKERKGSACKRCV